MKHSYRHALAALALMVLLASATLAEDGIMHTGAPATQPAPTVDGTSHTGATDGVIHTDGIIWMDATDTLLQPWLSLLPSWFTGS